MLNYNKQKLTNIMRMMGNLNNYENKLELEESKHQLNGIQTIDVQTFKNGKNN